MSLFQCENCGCVENTACANQGFKSISRIYDWSYAPQLKGKKICRACGPVNFLNDGKIKPDHWGEYGQWHNEFPRVFLPLGKFKTSRGGNIEHIETGSEKYLEYALDRSENPAVKH